MRTVLLWIALVAPLLSVGCAGPLYGGPPFEGTWCAADDELGKMTLEVTQGAANGVDCVLTGVDGQRFEFSGALSDEDDGSGGFEAELEVGDPGLQVLFGPAGTNEVEGHINFAMGRARAAFRRRKSELASIGPSSDRDVAYEPFLEARFWRESRPESTLKTIRLSEVR